jgi:hypothetical protein
MPQVVTRYLSSVGTGTWACLDPRFTTSGFNGFHQGVFSAAGVIRNLRTVLTVAPGAGATRTFALRTSAGGTGPLLETLSTTHGQSDLTATSTGQITIAAGDKIDLTLGGTGSPASSEIWYSFDFEPTTAGESSYVTALGTATSGYFCPFTGEQNATLSVVDKPVPIAGTFTLSTAGSSFASLGAGDQLDFYLYKNGVKQDGTGGTVNTRYQLTNTGYATSSTSYALSVVRGDTIAVGIEVVGGYPSTWTGFGLRFASTSGVSIVAGGGTGTPSAGVDNYLRPDENRTTSWSTDQNITKVYGGITAFTLRALYLVIDTDPGATRSRQFRVRRAGAYPSGGPGGTITGGGVLRIDDLTGSVRISQGESVQIGHTPSNTPTVSGDERWALVMDTSAVPLGNGENPGGTNPTAGAIPTTFALKFIQIRTHDGTSRYFGETLLSDNASWTAAPGKKAAKLVGVSKIRRALSNRGAFVTTRFTVTLSDTDRQFRALADSTMLRGAYLAVYVVDDAVRRAEGTPYRLMAGIVTSHRALPGFRYEIEAEDVLGHRLSEYNKQPTLPPDKFSLADFPGLDPALEGRTIPIAMGALVDDATELVPQGVVPALFVGYFNLSAIGGVDAVVDAYIFTQCAAAGVYNMYFNPPVWDESTAVEVGDVVRPTPDNASGYIYRATVAGTTSTTEPTWPTGVSSTVGDGSATWQRGEADTQDYRLLVPDAAYGTVLVTPGKPGWTAATGQTTTYLDYNGRRYTPLFILRSHRYAKAVREGRIIVTANLYGVTETSDGSGRYLDDPPRMWEWLLTQFVFGRYTTGAYVTPPTLDGTYAAIDHTSVEAAVTAQDARYLPTGYIGAMLLGAEGAQSTVFDELQKLCEGGDFDQGINRHGQLMVSVETVTASAVVTFDAQADIEDGQYESWIEQSDYANVQEHFWGRRYIQTSVVATPKQGDPLPRKDQRYGEWESGLTEKVDSIAIANAGERIKYTLENHVVRNDNVAENVGSTVFTRNLGALREGPRMVRFTTGWQGLGTGSTYVDLGSVIGLTHPERVGSNATATDVCRVLAIEVDPLRDRVTLECRVLSSIADASLFQQWAPVGGGESGFGSEDPGGSETVSGQSLA